LAISGVVNVVLGLKVVALGKGQAPVPKVKLGSHLDPLTGVDPDGTPITIPFDGVDRPTVLLVLRPGCEWCELNMPNWQSLVNTKSSSFRFVALSLSAFDLKNYMKANRLYVPTVFPADDRNPVLGTLTGTPQTIVVGSDGIVKKVWFGAYTAQTKHDVEAYFG